LAASAIQLLNGLTTNMLDLLDVLTK
jgi:hypothetical protein